LRYLIPFRKPAETIAYLEKVAQVRPGGVAAFGDDMEKFGCWPGTFKHCYEDGWLENFSPPSRKFIMAEDHYSRRVHVQPSAARPRGSARRFLREMMEWVLPTNIKTTIFRIGKEFASRPEVLAFLAWRFLARIFSEISRGQPAAQKNAASLCGGRVRSYTTNQPGVRRAKPGGP